MDRRLLGAAVAVVALGAAAPLLPSYPLTLLIQGLISAIFAMSLDVLLGYTGLPSLGHAAYFGVGAYAVAILSVDVGAGFLPCVAAALAAARPLALLVVAVAAMLIAAALPAVIVRIVVRHCLPLLCVLTNDVP